MPGDIVNDMILRVHLSNKADNVTEIPINPETTCKDVVEMCKEPGEEHCHLAENVMGTERAVGDQELISNVLQDLGPKRRDVRFIFRHNSPPTDSIIQQNGPSSKPLHSSKVGSENNMREQEENIRLEKLREKVEVQEEKLKRLRAVQGQADATRLSNDSLSAELESVKALFVEKEKELAKCFAKVEEMTHQLKQLQHAPPPNGRKNDLEHLKRELLNHNNRNEQQSQHLERQAGLLNQRSQGLKEVDKRIEELKELLHRKRSSQNVPSSNSSNKNNSNSRSFSNGAVSRGKFYSTSQRSVPPDDNGQYDGRQGTRGYPPHPHPQSSQEGPNSRRSLPMSNGGTLPADTNGNGSWAKPVIMSGGRPGDMPGRHQLSTSPRTSPQQNRHPVPLPRRPSSQDPNGLRNRDDNSGSDTSSLTENSSLDSVPISTTGLTRQRPPPPGNKPIRSSPIQNVRNNGSYSPVPRVPPGTNASANPNRNSTLSVRDPHTKLLQTRPAGDRSPMYSPSSPTASASWSQSDGGSDSGSQIDGHHPRDPTNRNNIPPSAQRHHPPSPPMPQRPVPAHRINTTKHLDATDSSTSKEQPAPPEGIQGRNSRQIFHQHSPATVGIYNSNGVNRPTDDSHGYDSEISEHSQTDDGTMAAISADRPASPIHDPTLVIHQYYKDTDRLQNMPRPLKKRISFTESKDENFSFMRSEYRDKLFQQTGKAKGNLSLKEEPEKTPSDSGSEGIEKEGKGATEGGEYSNDAILTHKQYKEALAMLSQSPILSQSTTRAGPHGILKREGKSRRKGVRVRFDPLALLLDASLEGEYDQVRRIIQEVPNPSDANDEGITALHNAICANHSKIVNFLILFGVDVNSPDSDGWTPLHCAASCNNLKMVRALVERGGCVFATTISDKESPAEKCEKEEDGYLGCFEYLNDIQEKMGVVNSGTVFGVYTYEAEKEDELSFKDGDQMKVLKKGDEDETEWWWASKDGREGYIPRNLVAMYPRVKPLFN
ncbi:apoptosis-stimulating of p53 protein 1-like isoform X3 [Apostichopus japonicus]|uniref:apoptosis-stimulating of p53 protein 1-like isoform X3 n=1 Tax=Stichopus japonicus TaxID=307972 RepID=UPI003AB72331